MSLNIGDVIDDKYRILRLVGEGGMGAVYEGENRLISRKVAIKVLYGAASMSQDAIQRFEREAQAAGRIGNDHILEVIDLGRLADGARYMVMEFLDGETLGERIKRVERIGAKELVPLFNQVLVGLQAAHDAGIVHRDLKPDNIFILKTKAGRSDFVKIIDFGISKFQDPSDHNMTRTGTVMGTPFYMSPEQAKGIGVDARSDIYAVAAMLYESLSGSVPFDGSEANDLILKEVSVKSAAPCRLPDSIRRFASVVQKGMARDAQHRFQSARDFAEALERWATTGAGVTLPPEAAANASPEFGATQLPQSSLSNVSATAGQGSLKGTVPGGVSPAGATTGAAGSATRGTWANSQPSGPATTERKWLPFAIAAGVVVVLGIGAMIAMGGDEKAAESEASAVPAAAAGSIAEEKPAENTVVPTQPALEQPAPAAQAPAVSASTPAAADSKLGSSPVKAARPSQPSSAVKVDSVKPVPAKPSTAAPEKKKRTASPAKVDFGY